VIVFYFLILILPLVKHPVWGERFGPFTICEYLGLLCLTLAIFRAAWRRKVPAIFSIWPTRLFFLLYLIAFLSALFSRQGVSLANDSVISYTSAMLLFVITVALVDTDKRLRWTILAVIGSYAWGSLYVIREWQKGVSMGIELRPGWIVGDSNYFATAAILGIALAFCFMQGKRSRWERYFCFGCLLVTIFGVTLCASRGGFLGLTITCLLLVGRTKNRVRNLALIAILVLPLSLVLPVSPLHRFLHPTISETGSEQNHRNSWIAGFRMIRAKPLTGVGLGYFKAEMPWYSDAGVTEFYVAHNMFIEVAAELGLPALLLFVSIFVASYVLLGPLRSSESDLIRDAAVALQAAVVGVAVAGCFVSAEYQKTTWTGLALIACLIPLARSKSSPQKLLQPPPQPRKKRRVSGSDGRRFESRQPAPRLRKKRRVPKAGGQQFELRATFPTGFAYRARHMLTLNHPGSDVTS
jgi:putative inorganic carbon (hco3(-)) transporter